VALAMCKEVLPRSETANDLDSLSAKSDSNRRRMNLVPPR
jgi:hypothetical protein